VDPTVAAQLAQGRCKCHKAARFREHDVGTHRFVIDGKKFEVEVGAREGGRVPVRVNGKGYDVEVEGGAAAAPAPVAPSPAASVAPPAAPAAAAAPAAGGAGQLTAPMAGLVLRVEVTAGQQVEAGQTVVVLEAMKMENAIGAPTAGTVKRIAVQPQQTVGQGDVLAEIG
jgi:biotin carboxyl carrier protein